LSAKIDYYRLLQVDAESDPTQIKKAYRKLAVIWHPDRNPDSPEAEERFKAIAEAYAVLSDPNKRKNYDLLGPDAFSGEFSSHDIFEGFDLNDLFKEFGLPSVKDNLFGILDNRQVKTRSSSYQDFFSQFGAKTEKTFPGKSPPLAIDLAVTLKEAVYGAVKSAAFNSDSQVVKVSVTVPPGSHNGQVIVVPQKVPGPARLMGDLLMTLNVIPQPGFRRLGQDILTTLSLTKQELMMGCQPTVAALDGQILRLNVPLGSRSGTKLKLSGHGVPAGVLGKCGDLVVTLLERPLSSSFNKK
jgi:curved DNA-binding protein